MCHVSCSHLPQPTCIPSGNYILGYVKMKGGALYGIQSLNVLDMGQKSPFISLQLSTCL